MKKQYLLLPLVICLSACTTAFEIGEALNRATSNIANDPGVLWSKADPASAPLATSMPVAASAPVITSEPAVTPEKEAK